ncbi:CCA tRNA nucleotidyltransferase [Campylobacter sp. MIT 99-7217]|uniref:CCA tRNA nucleotidyltransferase n=1 Tax=Campylobacter sp. MIT 99-7217 TaxID=535091 RepID=UPI00115AA8DB|nr:CCA tRNA nucleotidyltransferase [Campylobacter sp. MIT 99-7217]TQR32994.1 CCA tRNA nucleotidyltransferase [Campylobacter sp. MIT 99-7217]
MQISKISLKIDPRLLFIAEYLKPFTKRVYLVGGSVRDSLLNLELSDFDIEIYDLDPRLFDKLMQKLGANGVGKSFFVYKYKNYDLALARYENKISHGHKGFEVQICNDEKSGAKRRDFTINALMMNIYDGRVLDFYEGLKDLEHKILRHIDEKSFKEDSLRVLRAVHFVARFDLAVSLETLELMKTMDISDLSLDRINAELYKFFKASNLKLGFELLQELGLEEKIFHFYNEDKKRNEKFKVLLDRSRVFIKDEGLFLYLYLNFFNLDKKIFFQKTKLKKELFIKANEAFFEDEMSDFDLLKIALDKPLKEWLGLFDEKRVQRAKNLGFYDKKFIVQISTQKLIEQGFSGKILGEKIQALKEEAIKTYLKNLEEKR